MSDAWIPVAYALIAAISAGFSAWIAARYAVKSGIKSVDSKVDDMMTTQGKSAKNLATVKEQLNGRLDEWKQSLEARVSSAVDAASARSYQRGIEAERNRALDGNLDIKIANLERDRLPTKILLVDDDPDCALQFQRVAVKKGCDVVWVKHRDEAIAAMDEAKSPYDAVVVDEKLSVGPSGHEVILEIRKLRPDIITVLSSGYVFDVEMMKQLFPTIPMPKPITVANIETLMETVNQYRYWRSLTVTVAKDK